MSFLQLHNLQKTYPDGTPAVKGIDLTVDRGEFIVILGPSGCGKTTTLRMIAGLEQPTGGHILLKDTDVTNLPPSQRDIGFVFQFYALYPHMTVRQNIAFPLENLETSPSDIAQTISEVAKKLGITNLLNRHPGQLSGGDQQRVSLARAMVRKPDIYLMDEPLGTLDSEHRLELREFIRHQQLELGVTTLYVTHDQEEAMSLSDRIVVMASGEIRQIGTPAEIYHHPADLFVANFVGSPGMNLISGQVKKEGDIATFTSKSEHLVLSLPIKTGPITLGIRPEFIYPASEGLPAKIILSEYLGSHRYVHLDTPIGPMVMRRSASENFQIGAQIHIQLAPSHLCLFNTHTEKAL